MKLIYILRASIIIFVWGLCCFSINGATSTMLSSSKSGELSLIVQQTSNRQEMKFSTDFGYSWHASAGGFDKNSSNDDRIWISLSTIWSNECVLATRSQLIQAKNDNMHQKRVIGPSIIYVSLDFGKKWAPFLELSELVLQHRTIRAITSSNLTDFICVCSGRNIVASKDHGFSWNVSLLLNPAPPMMGDVLIKTSESGKYTYIISFSQTPAAEDRSDDMRHAYSGLVHMSSDFGTTWRVISHENVFYSRGNSLWVNSDGQHVFIGGGSNHVLHSSDYGKSFVNLLTNYPAVSAEVLNMLSKCHQLENINHKDDCISSMTDLENYNSFKDLFAVSAVTMSRNGLHLIVAAKSEHVGRNSTEISNVLVYSNDRGQSWSKMVSPAVGDSAITHMTVGDEGKKIIGVLDDGNIINISHYNSKRAVKTV